jgi:hypothetical protein
MISRAYAFREAILSFQPAWPTRLLHCSPDKVDTSLIAMTEFSNYHSFAFS